MNIFERDLQSRLSGEPGAASSWYLPALRGFLIVIGNVSNQGLNGSPACGGDAAFQAESTDDGFESNFAPSLRRDLGGHLDAIGVLDIGAIELPQMQIADAESLEQKRSNMRFLDAFADD
jgi:hypothetical protein